MDFTSLLSFLLLIFGFGFVIFWHELGHFLAAKWAGVKVEQFAVGFGQALLCWRKGIGTTVGTSAPRMQRAINDARARGELGSEAELRDRLGIGETEYRLNWIPLGGYVKMLGQDDMNPNSQSADPRSYNSKSIGKRMVIVSAGVIMNVILAAILFVFLFLYGFRTPAAVVGWAQSGSPADRAGLQAGDRILRFNGARMHDFNKIRIETALAHPTEPAIVDVQKPDGTIKTLSILPLPEATAGGFLQIGVGPAQLLEAAEGLDKLPAAVELSQPSVRLMRAGDAIAAINGQPLPTATLPAELDANWARFDQAVQASQGRPIQLTLKNTDGSVRDIELQPTFEPAFGAALSGIAGMQPRVVIAYLQEKSAARGKLQPGDVVTRVSANTPSHDAVDNPTRQQFQKVVESASIAGATIDIEVDRQGERVVIDDLPLNVKIESMIGIDRRGLGVGLSDETADAVVAGVLPESGAANAGIRGGVRIVSVAGQPVKSWFELFAGLRAVLPDQPVSIGLQTPAGAETVQFTLDKTQHDLLAKQRFTHNLPLKDRTELRQTSNPLVAMAWGAGETRDLITQFYITLKRMLIQQSISAKNLSGPVGIIDAGVRITSRGPDWLVWYLAIISANLAVVNFLPLPIVDGGLFVFLIIEKIRGKPLSNAVMTATQLVGLALLLSLFVFVTYNDILRLF
ncbi:MAG TPA: RIP metalloprotease RseP [Tepidisphaeraceae bacterium]|nr:RIP metalloprotease RseP [Tepidisphaeraceae bacterium]